MQKFAEDFTAKHNKINVEEITDTWPEEDEDGNDVEIQSTSYNITSIPGLENLTLNLDEEEEFLKLDSIIGSNPTLFSEFLGGKFGDTVEAIIAKISKGIFAITTPSRTIEMNINYLGSELTVILSKVVSKTNIGFIANHTIGVRRSTSRLVAIIKGLQSHDPLTLEETTRKILRSVLFDIEYTYGVSLEVTNLGNLKSATLREHAISRTLPTEPIRLMYKNYIPELIEYFHISEKVDHIPFKYICHFHVLEYFMDKSAYSVVARKVKQLLLSPDFHVKSGEYISNAINIIKVETERNATDKIKIRRVIDEFAQLDSIKSHLKSINALAHFEKDHTIQCGKPLTVGAIKFDSDQSFAESVSKRIYSIRCSIVHSNPEFDESKAVPFLPTEKNLDFLRLEIELIKEVARTIISNSSK